MRQPRISNRLDLVEEIHVSPTQIQVKGAQRMNPIWLFLLLLFVSLAIQPCSAQRVEMKPGQVITIETLPKNRGYVYTQDGKKLKFNPMCKTLETYDVCKENMALAHKHGVNSGILIGVGVLTFPIGYIIIMVPFIKQKQKQLNYVYLAVQDYNKYLENQKK